MAASGDFSYFLFNFDYWSFVEIDKLINLEISNLQIGKVANRYKFSSKGWHVDSVHEGKKQLKKYNYIIKTFSLKKNLHKHLESVHERMRLFQWKQYFLKKQYLNIQAHNESVNERTKLLQSSVTLVFIKKDI